MDCYIGMIFPWPLSWAPVDFMLCQGQTLQVTSYQALFSLIGTTYGGNGTHELHAAQPAGSISDRHEVDWNWDSRILWAPPADR